MSAEITKVGIVSCSGESIAEGTIARLATRRVLELLRPDKTVTICLPLFIAGNEGEQNFAKNHPTITIDGCPRQCARYGTEQNSGPVSAALIVSEILGTAATGCSRSSRSASKPDQEAVWTVAEQISARIDEVLLSIETFPEAQHNSGTACACSRPVPGGTVVIGGEEVTIPGLTQIFEQCVKRSIPAEESGGKALLDSVRIYHRILPEEETQYSASLLSAYRRFIEEK